MHEKIKNQIKDAMRAKDAIRLDVLRSLVNAFANDLISKGSAAPFVSDEDATAIIRRSVKQHKDSIEQFTTGGRSDLAEKEQAELIILEAFLPKLMSSDEIRAVVEKKLADMAAASAAGTGAAAPDKAKLGQFIGLIMKELKGKADGADVKAVVEEAVK